VLYHGTHEEFDCFESTPHDIRWAGTDIKFNTFYFTDNVEVASTYGPRVLAVELDLVNLRSINARGARWENFSVLGHLAEAFIAGCDGAIIKRIRDEHDGSGDESNVYVAFRPDQIRILSVFGEDIDDVDRPRSARP